MIYIETSNILSDDVLGFATSGAPAIDTLPERERERIVLKAIEIDLYARLPETCVLESLAKHTDKFTAVLSRNEDIAEQQVKWFKSISKYGGVDVNYTDSSEIEHEAGVLLIAEERDLLVKHAKAGGSVLPFTDATQFKFIIDIVCEATQCKKT